LKTWNISYVEVDSWSLSWAWPADKQKQRSLR
jgi:hypothetical protein